MSHIVTFAWIFGVPGGLALLALTLPSRAQAKGIVVAGLLIGLLALVRAIRTENALSLESSGFLAWWGSACILSGVLGYVARISLRHENGSQFLVKLALAFGATACAFVSGLLFEPLGGMLIR